MDYSVVLPHRGPVKLDHLSRTIDAWNNQTVKPKEIIISEQDTHSCLDGDILYKPNVKHIFREFDFAFSKPWAVNCGVVESENEMVFMHDNDTYMERDDYAESSLSMFEGMNCGIGLFWKDRVHPKGDPQCDGGTEHPSLDGNAGNSIIIKKTPYMALGGMDERMFGWGWEDTALACKFNTICDYFKIVPLHVLHHIPHEREGSFHYLAVINSQIKGFYQQAAPFQVIQQIR